MENNLYHWHDEMLAMTRMDDLRRETEKIQLIMDAGLYNPGFFERMGTLIGKALARLGLHSHRRDTEQQHAYQVTTCKYAS